MKIICSRNTAKNLSESANFPANRFLFDVRKNFSTAPFIDAQELDSWSTLKGNVCIFLYISVRKFLFQRRSKILSGGRWVERRLDNFLKVTRKVFYNFSFWIFVNSAIFQHFDTSIYSIKTLKLSRQSDLNVRTVAKFRIRRHFLSVQNNMARKIKN